MAIQINKGIPFCLQYLASVSSASPMPLVSPSSFNEPEPSEYTPAESVDMDPINAVKDQEIQVNLPKEGVDVGCQFHAKGEQLMMKSVETQTEFTFYIPSLCTTSTQVEEGDFQFKRKTHLSRKLPKQSLQRSPHKRMLVTSHQHQNVYRMILMYQDQMRRKRN